VVASLAGHGDGVTSIAFDPSGRTIVTGSSDGSARLWDALPEGTLVPVDTRSSPVQAFWAGNRIVSVARRQVRILTRSGRLLERFTSPAPITATAARGNQVAFADKRGDVIKADRDGFVTTPGSRVTAVAFESDRTLLTGSADGVVRDYGTNHVVQVGAPVLGLSTGGRRFLVQLAGSLRVYTDAGTLVSTIHVAALHAVLSPGGLGVATTKGTVAQLWDASTGRLLHTLRGHGSALTDAEFSPNGLELVTVSDDHTGRTWSARSGRLLHVLVGHSLPVRAGSYSPNGHWLVTASYFTAGLWNAATGQLLSYLVGHTAPLTGASFSPTGNWILTGSEDGTARVYHCAICRPLSGLEATAEARLRALR
jgi:WD40 repeat protein